MLRTSKQAHRIGLAVQYPYSLLLKMAAHIWKYGTYMEVWHIYGSMQKYVEIACRLTSHAHPLSVSRNASRNMRGRVQGKEQLVPRVSCWNDPSLPSPNYILPGTFNCIPLGQGLVSYPDPPFLFGGGSGYENWTRSGSLGD